MDPGAPQDKRGLRVQMAARRRAVPPAEAQESARAVARALLGEARLRSAQRIALYAAVGGELPSRPIFEALGELACPRLLPRVLGRELEWVEVEAWAELRPGRFGIPEPLGSAVAPPGPGDAVLAPGLAFDLRGGRLGRGGAYYDRAFPAQAPSPWLVGIGYRFQCLAALPLDSHDRRVDAIVTEAGFAWCREDA